MSEIDLSEALRVEFFARDEAAHEQVRGALDEFNGASAPARLNIDDCGWSPSDVPGWPFLFVVRVRQEDALDLLIEVSEAAPAIAFNVRD